MRAAPPLALGLCCAVANAQPPASVPLPPPPSEPAAPATRLNPTGRDIALTAPLRDGPFILGEIAFVLGADDSLRVNAAQLLDLLQPVIDGTRFATLQGQLAGLGTVPAEQITGLGFPIRYDPETIGLAIDIPPEARTTRRLQMRPLDDTLVGDVDAPAGFAGYVNFRGFTDYVWQGPNGGFQDPTILIDSAIRLDSVVFENEGTLQIGGNQPFRREGSRFVYDDRRRLIRWTAGDLRPISRGFSGTSQIAGLAAVRIYSVLEPQRNVQPRGDRSFTLTRPSTVETFINGFPVRRVRLDPGTYNASDFPFSQGANDVRLVISDDSGHSEVIEFSLFFDRTLLAPGLTEFGFYAGVLAPFVGGDRDYQLGNPAASGFIRRGVSETLTAGANFQLQERGGVVGIELVTATTFGTIGTDLAVSHIDGIGTGYAARIDFRRNFGGLGLAGRSVAVSAVYHSPRFATPNQIVADNRFSLELGASYSQALSELQFISVTGQYSIGRNPFRDEQSARVTYGHRLSPRLNLTVEAIYENRAAFGEQYGVRAGLVLRFGPRSSGSAEIDTRFERGRVGYQTSRGTGVGSWSASADVDYGDDIFGANASAAYHANRADLAISHTTAYDTSGSRITDQRTSLRLGTAIAFANGSFALSRPIYDSFAMVRAHPNLGGATVYVDPRAGNYSSRSDFFGPAVEPDLAAYTDRVVSFDVPNAPLGYDLGRGNFRVYPPYRSGYLVVAGSDYSVTAIGTLLDQNGDPVSLLAGRAIELAQPDRAPVTIFTNRAGRFGIQGLKPGRWRIEMPTQPPGVAVIEVSEGERGVVRLGEVRLGEPR